MGNIQSVGSKNFNVYRLLRNKYEIPFEDHPELKIEFKVIISVAQKGVRPTLPPHIPPVVEDLLRSCWVDDPEKRPSCDAILEKLDAIEKEFRKNPKKWNSFIPRNKS